MQYLKKISGAVMASAISLQASHTSAICADKSFIPFFYDGDYALDINTGFSWKICSYGQSVNGQHECVGEAQKLSYQEAQEIARHTQGEWRLPTKQEISTLIDKSCGTPTIDTSVFSNTQANWYWVDDNRLDSESAYFSFETGVYAWGNNEHFHFYLRLIKARHED